MVLRILTYLSVDVGVRAVTQAGQVELPSPSLPRRRPVCRLRLSPHLLSLSAPRRAGAAPSSAPLSSPFSSVSLCLSVSVRVPQSVSVSECPLRHLRCSFPPDLMPPGMPSVRPFPGRKLRRAANRSFAPPSSTNHSSRMPDLFLGQSPPLRYLRAGNARQI